MTNDDLCEGVWNLYTMTSRLVSRMPLWTDDSTDIVWTLRAISNAAARLANALDSSMIRARKAAAKESACGDRADNVA